MLYRNPFTEKSEALQKENNKNHLHDKSKKIFNHKTFSERFNPLFKGTNFLSFLCGGVSALSAFIIVFLGITKSLYFVNIYLSNGLGVLGGLVAVIIVEWVKRNAFKEFLVELFLYKRFSLLLFPIVSLACFISIYSSYKGAKLLPEITEKEILLIDIDSIKNAHNNSIAEFKQLNTYKPTKTLIKGSTALILAMQAEKDKDVLLAEKENEKRLTNSKKSKEFDVTTFAIIALINEGVLLGCLLFGMYYYWQCFAETKTGENDSDKDDGTDFSPITEIKDLTPQTEPHTVTGQRKIGFFSDKNETIQHENSATESLQGSEKRKCLFCGNEYEHNHNKQKYCSDRCRIKNYRLNNPKKLKGL